MSPLRSVAKGATPGSATWGSELRSGVVLALTGIHWREGWKYGLRAYRLSARLWSRYRRYRLRPTALGWRARVFAAWGDHGEWAWSKIEAAPAHLPLYQLTVGDARAAARMISCHQDMPPASLKSN